MMIARRTLTFTLTILLIGSTVGTAAPLAPQAGVQIPLAGVGSVQVADGVRLEGAAVFPGFTAPLVAFEGRLAGKLYIGPYTLLNLPFNPFIGAGAVGLYSKAIGSVTPGLVGLVGMEHQSADLPISLFLEGSTTLLTGGSSSTLVFGLSIGARVAIGP